MTDCFMCKKEIVPSEQNYHFWQRDYHIICWKETVQGSQGYFPESITQEVYHEKSTQSFGPFAFPGPRLP